MPFHLSSHSKWLYEPTPPNNTVSFLSSSNKIKRSLRVRDIILCKKFVLIVMACLPSLAFAWYPRTVDINTDNFSEMITYSDHHPFTGARSFTALSITGLPSQCGGGIYYNSSTNKESHSLILSAYLADSAIAQKRITIEFDMDQDTSPWESPSMCAMTHVRIRK